MRVVDADPSWSSRGRLEITRLTKLLESWLTGGVEHVGSTSVPGLAAKPILDFQAGVTDLTVADRVADVLAPDGWLGVDPALDARPWRRFLVQVVDDHRAAHLHLLVTGSPRWTEQLAFRDTLRADPSLAAKYGALKRDLAARYETDRETYTAAKADFVRAVLARPA